jgi:hypothetical protein
MKAVFILAPLLAREAVKREAVLYKREAVLKRSGSEEKQF